MTALLLKRWLSITIPIALLPTLGALGVYLINGPICMGQGITFDLGDLVVFFGSSSWLDGQGILYRDILSEYPLLANLIFGTVRLLSFALLPLFNAFTSFTILWVLFSGAALATMIRFMKAGSFPREAFWAIVSPPTIHFALLRYDIYPALFCFLSLWDLKKDRLTRAALWLGLCIAVKGYALFVLPAFAVFLFQKKHPRETLRLLAIAVAPFLLSQVAIYLWAGLDGVLGPFQFQMGREFNGESLYDSVALILETLGASSQPFRDFILASPIPKLIAIGTSVGAALMRPKTFEELVDAWLFAVTGFILSSVFISPQWLLWMIPIACFSNRLSLHRLMAGLSYATFIYYPIAAGLAALTGPFIHSASMAVVNVFRVAILVDIARRDRR